MRSLFQMSLLALVTFSITACGFHLRGQLPISEAASVLYVDAKDSTFKTALEKRLKKNGATLVADPTTAKLSLTLGDVRLDRRTSTIDQRGKVNSYNLDYIVDYSLIDAEGNVVKTQSLRESRNYTFDPARVLQQEREEQGLIEDMNDELVLRLVRQLSKI